ncbi:Uncharacterised protein [Escherichia fergusonii]|nr:Uncharacterised protein [Escherichia fergusonii]
MRLYFFIYEYDIYFSVAFITVPSIIFTIHMN